MMKQSEDIEITLVFKEVSLIINRAKISQDVIIAHLTALMKTSSRYHITRTEVKPFTIAEQSIEAFLDNVVIGQLPSKIYLACIDNDSFNGFFLIYIFSHFNINFYLIGTSYPGIPFTPNFQ